MNKLEHISDTLLLGPGPSTVNPNVYKALSVKTVGHLDPRFIQIMDEIKNLLRVSFKTENDFCMPISGTGSAAMEACFVNLIDSNDKVLIIQNGYFSVRMEDMCTRLGANIDVLKFDWGKPADVNAIEEKIKNILVLVQRYGFEIDRFFAFKMSKNVPEQFCIYHFVIHHSENNSKQKEIGKKKLTKALQTLSWIDTDKYSNFFTAPYSLSLNAINFTRAAAAWTHIILSKENPYYYSEHKIFECFDTNSTITADIISIFREKFSPDNSDEIKKRLIRKT